LPVGLVAKRELRPVASASNQVDPEELGRLIQLAATRGWLSIRQAAQFFPQHYLTVRGWVLKGHMRSVSIGSRQVITWEEIERFKKEGNWKDPQPITTGAALEANGAGGGNSPPVAQLGDYNPDVQSYDH